MRFGIQLHGMLRTIALIGLALVLWLANVQAHASIVGPWSLSGPGATSVDEIGSTAAFTYALAPAGAEIRTWTATANVLESGLYQFDWQFSGSHAETQVTAFLNTINPAGTLVNEGPVDCCIAPSIGFDFSGSASFAVIAGQSIGFAFGGSNADANNTLIGSLQIATVPLPATVWMFLAAMTMTAFLGRRRQRRML